MALQAPQTARYEGGRLEHLTWLDDGYETAGHVLVAHEGERLVAFSRVARNGRPLSDLLLVPRADILARRVVEAQDFFDPDASPQVSVPIHF